MKKIILFFVLLIYPYTSYANCGAIKNADKRNFCLANQKRNAGFCGAIRNADYRNYCLAVIKNNRGFCGAIRSSDFRNQYLAEF